MKLISIAASAALLVGLAGCSATPSADDAADPAGDIQPSGAPAPDAPKVEGKPNTVTYVVTSDKAGATAQVMPLWITGSENDTVLENAAELPYTYEKSVDASDFTNPNASWSITASGDSVLTCAIYWEGELKDQKTSEAGGTASCETFGKE
jgi:hypothetical protein